MSEHEEWGVIHANDCSPCMDSDFTEPCSYMAELPGIGGKAWATGERDPADRVVRRTVSAWIDATPKPSEESL